jgi:hypothetical protein
MNNIGSEFFLVASHQKPELLRGFCGACGVFTGKMLVDFLKGNHLSKGIATLPWLWAASRRLRITVADRGSVTTKHQYLWGVLHVLVVGPGPLVGLGEWLIGQAWHLEGPQKWIRHRGAADVFVGSMGSANEGLGVRPGFEGAGAGMAQGQAGLARVAQPLSVKQGPATGKKRRCSSSAGRVVVSVGGFGVAQAAEVSGRARQTGVDAGQEPQGSHLHLLELIDKLLLPKLGLGNVPKTGVLLQRGSCVSANDSV